MEQVETIIVGGGISGLACARRLFHLGQDFRLISDRLGGRMLTSPQGHNLGAAYVTRDYAHVLPFVENLAPVHIRDIHYWDGERMIGLYNVHNMTRLGKLARFFRLTYRFRRRLAALRKRAPWVCQKALMEADPLLREYTAKPALEFVREHSLERITEVFVGPIIHTTLFIPWQEINAFYYLMVMLPAIVPTYAFDARRAVSRLTTGFEHRLISGKVIGVEETESGYVVEGEAGRWQCKNLVLAVPKRNSDAFFPTEAAARNAPYCTVHVRGHRRAAFSPRKSIFLRDEHPIRVLWRQRDGVDVVYAPRLDPDLSAYYTDYEIIDAVSWKTAMVISGAKWRSLQLRSNLFAIGDHNIAGLEHSYVTGLFAANRIAGENEPPELTDSR